MHQHRMSQVSQNQLLYIKLWKYTTHRETWSLHYRRNIKKKMQFCLIFETAINLRRQLTSFASEHLYKHVTPSATWFCCHWRGEALLCAWETPWFGSLQEQRDTASTWNWGGDGMLFIKECHSKLLLVKTFLNSEKLWPKVGLQVLPSLIHDHIFTTQDTIY